MSRLAVAAMICAAAGVACDGAPAIEATTVINDTADQEGPYEVTTVVVGATSRHNIELFYSVDSGDRARFIPRPMRDAIDDHAIHEGEVFVGEIPGQSAGAVVRYFVAVISQEGELSTDPPGGAGDAYQFSIQ